MKKKKKVNETKMAAFKILTQELDQFTDHLNPSTEVFITLVRLKSLMDAFVVYMWEVEAENHESNQTRKKK